MTTPSNEPLRLFYCYAHEDRTLRNELDAHLSGLRRDNLVQGWYDREIRAGTDWQHEINNNLTAAHIILLLVSADFLNSDYCYGIEMDQALQQHRAGTSRVVPIILRSVLWRNAPFSKLQVLPTGAIPVTRWPNRDDAFEDIANELCNVVEDLRAALRTKEEQASADALKATNQSENVTIQQPESSSQPSLPPPPQQHPSPIQQPPEQVITPPSVSETSEASHNQPSRAAVAPQTNVPTIPPSSNNNPGSTNTNSNGFSKKAIFIALVCILLIVSVIVGVVYPLITSYISTMQATATAQAKLTATAQAYATITALHPTGLGVTMIKGEPIGVSDGRDVLDTGSDLADVLAKRAAARSLASGDTTGASLLLTQAISEVSNDAEAFIYREDIVVSNSNSPYITFVVGTTLSGDDSGAVVVGRDDLQGAYIAQKEFNDDAKLHGGLKIKLFIANAGSNKDYATRVAIQIINLAHSDSDKTFMGVMGWPYSDYALTAVPILGAAGIPMVSQTASSDRLKDVSPYFFRVAPPNLREGTVGAIYAENVLHAKSAVIFSDPSSNSSSSNSYSPSLAEAFKTQFVQDGNQVIATEAYTVGKPETLPALLADALSKKPDLLYFSGYASDLNTLLGKLPSNTTISIMGGNALYELGGYSHSPGVSAGFTHLHFTAFFYPDVWSVLGQNNNPNKPDFLKDYPATFGTVKKTGYHYFRPSVDNALSYDATSALLNAYNMASASGKLVTLSDMQQALTKTTFQGVSGQIAFDKNGEPINKAILILSVNAKGEIGMDPTQPIGDGDFFKGQ